MQSDQLEALRAVVDDGTFEAAARSLHITPSAVSQRIKALELRVGAVLVSRTKPVAPTASGEVLVRLARQIQTLTDGAERELAFADGLDSVSLAVNSDSLATWVLPALAPLAGSVILDIHRDDQDYTAELLRGGTVTAAVTSIDIPVRGCVSTRLGAMHYRPCAAPSFVDRFFGGGVTSAALEQAHVVVFDHKDSLQDRYLARHGVAAHTPPRHLVPSSTQYAQAVRLGFGWGMLPDQQRGGLDVIELDDTVIDVALFWQQWTLSSPALNAVAEAVIGAARAVLT
ncbi:MAG: LysR family transcriptional regulator ArgP [Rhodococcus sp. (in: high G+C Gram-positive bacteria)]